MKNRLLNIHVNRIIYSNALILFDENSKPVKVDYERHTCSRLNETPGNGKNEKIFNSVIVAIYLWNSWEIHIKNSTYPFEWYGCVQVEDEWLQSGRGTPPLCCFQ